jgi:hypothetical protein
MSNLELYKDVWVISLINPTIDTEEDDVVVGVFQSEEVAKERHKELMSGAERAFYMNYCIKRVPMLLDVKVRGEVKV